MQQMSSVAAQSKPRPVRLVLRDGDWVTGAIHLTEGRALAPYLASRKGGWTNLLNVSWASEGMLHHHAVLQADHILWAVSKDPDLRVGTFTSASATREVDFLLEDGTRLYGRIQLAERQRLSDYLASCVRFIPVFAAARPHGGERFGDLVLNAGCVKALRDGRVIAAGKEKASGSADWGGLKQVPAVRVPLPTPGTAHPSVAQRDADEALVPAHAADLEPDSY